MQCNQPEAQKICEKLAAQLHQQSRFALGVTHLPKQMTSNMELRIQCGGINGLVSCVSPVETLDTSSGSPVDLYRLIQQAIIENGSLDQLPYPKVAQSISQWKPKRRTRRKE